MSNRYKGGVISATPPTLVAGAGASGTWTLEQQMQATAAGLWPTNAPFYIEEVFSTWLYTGTGAAQTITNGVDLSGKGGLVWTKSRSASSHRLFDTVRGATKVLYTEDTSAQSTEAQSITSFGSTGFTLGTSSPNASGDNYVSWTFREQPKFFDVVTFTGNGSSGQTIAHNLQSGYGFIAIKRTDSTSDWFVLARNSSGSYWQLKLNSTAANTGLFSADPDISTVFYPSSVIGAAAVNGGTYVAYLFAHNAGGFGLTGTDNVISCGSYTGNGTSGVAITLGYEPQWLLVKRTDLTGNWLVIDTMRGFPVGSNDTALYANTSGAEVSGQAGNPTATGFDMNGSWSDANTPGGTYIYIAIRRGPMKVPTTGTSVFTPVARTGDGTGGNPSAVTTGIVTDSAWVAWRNGVVQKFLTATRLLNNRYLATAATSGDTAAAAAFPANTFDLQNGFFVGNDNDGSNRTNGNGGLYINYAFRRAPSFFDVVCYTGDSNSGRQITHNLGVAPELGIVKNRTTSPTDWPARCSAATAGSESFFLNTTASGASYGGGYISGFTSSYFTVASDQLVNSSGETYIAYLFATCPGVSKVGSYTGTGTTQIINCGFTAGSRFVMIKRTDSTGDWYVWDTARGIVAGNDPFLRFNLTSAENTTTDYIDTAATGFEISSTAPAAINANGGTFIFLAIA
jgi:hypothetical protein